SGYVHRPNSERRKALRSTSPAVHESPAGHQFQNRQGARSYRPSLAAWPCRRGDRMTVPFVAVHEAGCGTSRQFAATQHFGRFRSDAHSGGPALTEGGSMNPAAVLTALASAALFGVSTPAAKALLGVVHPVILAGLFYCCAGIGIALLRALAGPILNAPTARQPPLARQDYGWLAG